MRMGYYDQDGSPIEDTLAWAAMMEDWKGRTIGQCETLYGEKLSTVWLGLDHQCGIGPPLIFETMLFAPRDRELYRRGIRELIQGETRSEEDKAKIEASDKYLAKHYPHDQLQLRYSTKAEARKSFERLRLQCLIPPRLRRFLLYKIGKDDVWS